jgi:hypothetical protein
MTYPNRNKKQLEDRQRELFLWVDESFVCSLFKADLNLGWFFANRNRALETRPEAFDATIDACGGDPHLASEIKQGYRELIDWLRRCEDVILDSYQSMGDKQKLKLNWWLAKGLAESSRRLFTGYDGSVVEQARKVAELKWRKQMGAWILDTDEPGEQDEQGE